MSYRDRVVSHPALTPRFRRFFSHLFDHTDVTRGDVNEMMRGAHVEVADGGRFYKLMVHDILLCERKRRRGTDDACDTCTNVYRVYYERATYGRGSSHQSWRDDDYPQYRLGKSGALLPNLYAGRSVSRAFDLLIGLRRGSEGVRTWFQFEAARGEDRLRSRADLVQLDNESALAKTYRMSTLGHIRSTLSYGRSGLNQGPFGESGHNDADPLVLHLTPGPGKRNRFWAPIAEADSVRYRGETDCNGVTRARK